MKKSTIVMLCMVVLSTLPAVCRDTSDKDTVIIEFGKKSKIVIVAESEQDLKDLQDYDINLIISELNTEIDSVGPNVQALSMLDQSGTRFLKDSVQESNSSDRLEYYGEDNSSASSTSTWTSYDNDRDYDDYDLEYSDKSNRRTYSAFEFQLGMNNWLEDGSFPDQYGAPYAVKPWGSWYVAVGANNKTQLTGPLILNWGADISWYAWKMENRSVRIVKGETETTFIEDTSVHGTKSKLGATYLNLSMVPMLDFSFSKKKVKKYGTFRKYGRKGFRIGAGGYIGYRIDSWTKFVYNEPDGDKKKDKTKSNYYLNSFRYGLRGQIGYKGMDFFFNYDLNNVFSDGRGPKLNAISFGIIL